MKIAQLEEESKEVARRQMQEALEFDKTKALMEQKISFITGKNQELEEKEKKLQNELKQQKQDSSAGFSDQKQKFEQKLQELSSAL